MVGKLFTTKLQSQHFFNFYSEAVSHYMARTGLEVEISWPEPLK